MTRIFVRGPSRVFRWFRVWYLHSRFGSFGRGSYVEAPIDLLTNPGNAEIGRGVYIRHHLRLECHPSPADGRLGRLQIGDGTHVEGYCSLGSASSVVIGRDVLMGANVTIRDHDHGFADTRRHRSHQELVTAPVEIGDYVWLGQNSVVLRGVRIGAGAVVGANAVVTRSVPAGAIAVGVPARIVGWCDPARDADPTAEDSPATHAGESDH